jgi:hypothetical protein
MHRATEHTEKTTSGAAINLHHPESPPCAVGEEDWLTTPTAAPTVAVTATPLERHSHKVTPETTTASPTGTTQPPKVIRPQKRQGGKPSAEYTTLSPLLSLRRLDLGAGGPMRLPTATPRRCRPQTSLPRKLHRNQAPLNPQRA